jgi:hypothetical protein
MAQVVRSVHERIDLILGILEEQWGRLPAVETEIDGWDPIDQIVFIEEWPLEEQRLDQMKSYAAEGALTEEQMARYEDLKRVVTRNRPIIRRLQNS